MKAETARRLPYPGGLPVYPSRYVIFSDGTRRVALRFFNASEIVVTGVKFRLSEKDAAGNTIAEHALERRGICAERGSEFGVADVPVSPACVAVEARICSALSGDYEYVVEGDGVQVRYGGESAPDGRDVSFTHPRSYRVQKRRKLFVLLSFLSVLLFAAVGAALAWRLGIGEEIGTASATATAERIILDYEA